MTGDSFNNLPWHDAVMLDIHIDRRHPGHSDVVVLRILWPNEQRSQLTFTECYAFSATMNFGIVADEAIQSATEQDDSHELHEIREKWVRAGVDLSGLKCFAIETSSTASTLLVYANAWVNEFE